MIRIDPSVLIFFVGGGHVRLYHVHTRANLVTSVNLLEILSLAANGIERHELEDRFKGYTFSLDDRTSFTLWDGMYNNPDYYAGVGEDGKSLLPSEVVSLLLQYNVLYEGETIEYTTKKRSALDRYKGSIHEQLCTESLFRKVSLERWWLDQKFLDGGREVRDTPYKHIQQRFLTSYFAENIAGREVLDVGSGTGYYANLMADHAAHVVGLDSNESYVRLSRELWCAPGRSLQFFQADLLDPFPFPCIAGCTFDYIFIIDIVLFMFSREYQPDLYHRRVEIMSNLGTLLRPGGRAVVVDPHPFWLTPRFGSPEHPFGVVTEYVHRTLKVTPTLEEVSELFHSSGFRIARVFEPFSDTGSEWAEPLDLGFMNKFPQWWVFELVRR
jgi:SAM-dependent methyltransferase